MTDKLAHGPKVNSLYCLQSQPRAAIFSKKEYAYPAMDSILLRVKDPRRHALLNTIQISTRFLIKRSL